MMYLGTSDAAPVATVTATRLQVSSRKQKPAMMNSTPITVYQKVLCREGIKLLGC
jgi:hypothetical protein